MRTPASKFLNFNNLHKLHVIASNKFARPTATLQNQPRKGNNDYMLFSKVHTQQL